jgi:hypothetical protein
VLFRFLPLGAASILIVPLYWTLPRVVRLQTAVPAAVAEGAACLRGSAQEGTVQYCLVGMCPCYRGTAARIFHTGDRHALLPIVSHRPTRCRKCWHD